MKRSKSSASSEGASSYATSHDATTITGADSLGGASTVDSNGVRIKRTGKLDRVLAVIIGVPCASFEHSRRWAAFYQVLEYIQVFLYLILPLWNWNIDPEGNVFFKWFYRIHFQLAASMKTLDTAAALMYFCGVCVCFNALFLVHVGYMQKTNKPVNKWILRVGRLFLQIFSQLFFMNVMNFFLLPSACDWWGRMTGVRNAMLYDPVRYEAGFPFAAPSNSTTATATATTGLVTLQACFKGGWAGHAAIGAVFFIIHVCVGAIAHLRYAEFMIKGGTPNHQYGCVWILQVFIARVFIAVLTHQMTGWRPELAAFLVFLCCVWMLTVLTIAMPYGTRIENVISLGWTTMLVFVSGVLFVKEAVEKTLDYKAATVILAAGFGPSILVGFVLYLLRARHLKKRYAALAAVFNADPAVTEDAALDQFLFKGPLEASHMVRQQLRGFRGGEMPQELIPVAEFCFRLAIAQFPSSSLVLLSSASFKCHVSGDLQQGHSQAEMGTKNAKNPLDRLELYIFTKKTNKRSGADDSLDLSNYMEFAANWKAILRLHRKCLTMNRSFWMQMLHSEIKLKRIVTTSKRMADMIDRTDVSYKQVIERYPRSVGILRTYARFLDECRLDPVTASRYLTEADKLEDRLVEQHRDTQMNEDGAVFSAGLTDLDESPEPVAMINPAGLLVYVNKALANLFGYKKIDLEGKMVNMLMPPPFSQQHGTYLKNYLTTGTPRVLDKRREVVAIHRDRYVFPIMLLVRKVNNGGMDYFMGSINPIPEDPTVSTIWIATNGLVISISQSFQDLTGWKSIDLTGKRVSAILSETSMEDTILNAGDEMDLGDESKDYIDIGVKHQFGDSVHARVRMRKIGTEAVPMLALSMQIEDASKTAIFSINGLGKITYANNVLSTILGYSPKELLKSDLTAIVREPYGMLHTAWMRGVSRGPTLDNMSCSLGRVVHLKTRTNRPVPFLLRTREAHVNHDGPRREDARVINCSATLLDAGAAMHGCKMQVIVESDRAISRVVGTESSFGYTAGSLDNSMIERLVDLPEGNPALLVLLKMAERSAEKGAPDVVGYRVGVRNNLGVNVPSVICVGGTPDGRFDLSIYNAEKLDGMLECTRDGDGKVLDVDEKTCAIFGFTRDYLLKKTVAELMPGSCRKIQDLLLDESAKKGGMRSRHVGPYKEVSATHADAEPLRLGIIACLSKENPDKMYIYISVVAPSVSHLPEVEMEEEDEEPVATAAQSVVASIAAPKPKRNHRPVLPMNSGRNSGFMGEAADVVPSDDESERIVPRRGARGGARAQSPIEQKTSGANAKGKKGSKGSDEAGSSGGAGGSEAHDESGSDTEAPKVKAQTLKWLTENFQEPEMDENGNPVQGHGMIPAHHASSRNVVTSGAGAKGKEAEGGFRPGRAMFKEDKEKSPAPSDPSEVPGARLSMVSAAPAATAGFVEHQGSGQAGGLQIHQGTLDEVQSEADGSHASEEQGGINGNVDTEKARRHTRLGRILSSPRALEGMRRLKYGSVICLGILILIHVIQFAIVKDQTKKFETYITFTADSGRQIGFLYRILTATSILDAYDRGINYVSRTRARTVTDLSSQAATLEDLNQKLYLGKGTGLGANTPDLKALYQTPNLETMIFEGGTSSIRLDTLFDAINNVVSYARTIGTTYGGNSTTNSSIALGDSAAYKYLQANGPTVIEKAMTKSVTLQLNRSEKVLLQSTTVFIAFLVVECLFVIPIAIATFYFLVRRVLAERVKLFAVFAAAPSVLVCELAQRATRIDADEEEDDGEGDDDLAKRALMSAAAAQDRKKKRHAGKSEEKDNRPRAVIVAEANAKAVRKLRVSNTSAYFSILWVPLLWFIVAVATVAASWSYLLRNVDSLYMLKGQALEDVSITKNVYWVNKLGVETNLAQRALLRKKLVAASAELSATHADNIYGSSVNKIPKNVLTKGWYFNMYFAKGCLRTNERDGCVPESNGWYWPLYSGLDPALLYFTEIVEAIASDTYNTMNLMSNRFRFVLESGPADISDGTDTATKVTIKDGNYLNSIIAIQTAALVVLIVGSVAFYIYILRPFMLGMQKERAFLSQLMSEIPKTFDIESHCVELFNNGLEVQEKAREKRRLKFFSGILRFTERWGKGSRSGGRGSGSADGNRRRGRKQAESEGSDGDS